MRVVLDTIILVRAHAKAIGPAREVLQLIAGSAQHTLLLSPILLWEPERVLDYERVRQVTKLSDEEVAEYLGCLQAAQIAEMIFPGASATRRPGGP